MLIIPHTMANTLHNRGIKFLDMLWKSMHRMLWISLSTFF